MPDVTIEPWMREAAESIATMRGVWPIHSFHKNKVREVEESIATAYAAREQGGELVVRLREFIRGLRSAAKRCEVPDWGAATYTAMAQLEMIVNEYDKSALAGETR